MCLCDPCKITPFCRNCVTEFNNIQTVKPKEKNMFKFDLNEKVKVVVSGEAGTIKARADYSHGESHYLIHYKTADGRAVDGWFLESELEKVE